MFHFYPFRSIVVVLVLILCSQSLYSQFFLNSQADVDAFDQTLTTIGDLTIQSINADVLDLSNLSNLREITGTLRIASNPELESLNGLNNIESASSLEILLLGLVMI